MQTDSSAQIPIPLFDRDRLNRAMDEAGLDALVAHSRYNFYYLSGFESLDYVVDPQAANFCVFPRDPSLPATVTIPMSERLNLLDRPIWVPQMILCGRFFIQDGPPVASCVAENSWDGLLMALSALGLARSRIGFELDLMSCGLQTAVRNALPKADIREASELFDTVRRIKTPEEIRRVRIACEHTEEAIVAAIALARHGMSELCFAAHIASGIAERGGEVRFLQIGTRGAAGLGFPGSHAMEDGDVIRIDVSAAYEQYASDLGRSFVLGKPVGRQELLYETAYEALRQGIAAIRPGARASDVFRAAMTVWHDAGFADAQRNHTGHAVGLLPFEQPVLSPDSDILLESGMIFAVEAPLYIYGEGGFAAEDVCLVGDFETSQFTHAPAKLTGAG
jgi:Xaa-Pro dipeptidase